jgi:hypothetical protein
LFAEAIRAFKINSLVSLAFVAFETQTSASAAAARSSIARRPRRRVASLERRASPNAVAPSRRRLRRRVRRARVVLVARSSKRCPPRPPGHADGCPSDDDDDDVASSRGRAHRSFARIARSRVAPSLPRALARASSPRASCARTWSIGRRVLRARGGVARNEWRVLARRSMGFDVCGIRRL